MEANKKSFKMPHVFAVLMILMLFATILTYVVPSGQFERIADPATGRPVLVPGSFQFVEKTDMIGFMDFFSSIYTGMVEGGIIMSSLLILSGSLFIIESTGTFSAGIHSLLGRTKGKEFSMVVTFYSVFVLFGVLGYGEGAYPFYPLIVGVIMALGYDRMTGAAVALVGSAVGFTSGLVNMFTTGIGQQLVGLPLFSGMGFRAVGLVIFYIIGLAFIYSYVKKIKKDPNNSLTKEEYLAQKESEEKGETVALTGARIAGLAGFFVLVCLQGYGALMWKWGLPQISGIYVVYALIMSAVFRIGPSDLSMRFTKGAERVLGAAMAIGFARSIMVLLNAGNILDTFIYYLSESLMGKGPFVTLLIVYGFITIFNFFVTSGSGKAVMVMPILSPLGNLLNINQQVMVLAYQYGDGFTNFLWPAGAMVCTAICGVDYGAWLKYAWKTFLSLIIAGYALVLVANAIGYGPF